MEETMPTKKEIDNIDLEGKYVVVGGKFKPEYDNILCRIFLCKSGFGCNPHAVGTKVFGHFVCDGEECYVRRYKCERLATEKEVRDAEAFMVSASETLEKEQSKREEEKEVK